MIKKRAINEQVPATRGGGNHLFALALGALLQPGVGEAASKSPCEAGRRTLALEPGTQQERGPWGR